MIQQATPVDLTVARSSAAAVVINTAGATWVRFETVPSTVYVKSDSAGIGRIPVSSARTIRGCGGNIDSVAVDNNGVAGVGTLIILFGDNEQELADFLGSSSSSQWETLSVFTPDVTGAAGQDLISGATIGAGATGWFYDAANQVMSLRMAPNATAQLYRENGPSLLQNILQPGGLARYRQMGYQERVIVEARSEMAGNNGEYYALFGYFIQGGGAGACYGAGFAYRKEAGGVAGNWRAAILNVNGGIPFPQSPNLFQDLGVASNVVHELEFRWGSDGADAFAEWYIDDVLLYRITRAPIAIDWASTLRWGVIAIRHNIADTHFLHLLSNPLRQSRWVR